MALFIEVQVDAKAAKDPAVAKKLVEVCPVNIFALKDGEATVVEANLDECTLCELCLDAAPAGTVRVKKLYGEGEILQR